jgi:glycosyltransferase involved in cell wall biosynthesis
VKVSIVTISFNQARFLERALDSVLGQTYQDVEYIVVDPGSTDGSRDLIERRRDELAAIVLDPDDGPADGLNRGFALATGDVYGYLNADDVLLPYAVERAVAAFAQHPDVDVVYGHGYMVDDDDRVLRRFHSTHFTLWRYAFGAANVMQQASFYRREAFEAVGGFNTANRAIWDAELLVDLGLANKRFLRVDDYWALFRLHEDSISGSGGGTPDPKRAARIGKAAPQIQVNYTRLFEKITGRPRRRSDRLVRALARLLQWATDPTHVAIRVREVAAGSRLSRLLAARAEAGRGGVRA